MKCPSLDPATAVLVLSSSASKPDYLHQHLVTSTQSSTTLRYQDAVGKLARVMLFTIILFMLSRIHLAKFVSKSAGMVSCSTFVRCAKWADIARIDACNRAYLPENYQPDFYENHLIRWPELALVAVTEQDELMGYVLGRTEELPSANSAFSFFRYDDPPEYVGHLASVATHAQHRGRGVAQALVQRLHFNLAEYYEMDKVNLYCRPSNVAALTLYQQQLQYEVTRTIPHYYPDGEAGLMLMHSGLRARLLALPEDQRRQNRLANALDTAVPQIAGDRSREGDGIVTGRSR